MEKQQEEPKVSVEKMKPRTKTRRWLWVLAGALIVLILIVLLIPVAISSQRFTRWLGARISNSTGGRADIGHLSVGWFRGVQVSNFSFQGPDGWAQVNINRITTQPNYAGLLSGNLGLDRTVIDQPRVAIDLRNRPPATDEEPLSFDMNDIARLHDVVIRDGSIQVTDTTGRTTQLAAFDSTLNMRPAGQTSQFNLATAVGRPNTPGRIRASGQITPDKQQGWSLHGTTGDITVEVNELDLGSVAPFLSMAGVQVQAQGTVSADIQGAVQDGQIENLDAKIVGQNLNISGEALKGDSLQTSQLNAQAGLTRSNEVINIDRLNIQTDWATVSARGRLPTTVQSMNELLESGGAYDLRGNFNVDLAAVLSQMPNTVGVQEGMEITGGRATGTIGTTTEGGLATLVAEAQITDLAGTVNNETVALSAPVEATMRLSTDPQGGSRLEGLNVTAPFAQVSAGGSFDQIQYKGQINLAALQSELGPFVNLGAYKIAGRATSTGQVSIQGGFLGTTGTLSAQQIVVTTPDGNSVSEPQVNVNFAVGLNQQQQVLTVDTLSANAGFGSVNVRNATIPYGQDANAPLNVAVSAQDVDLAALKPYAIVFGSFPPELGLTGVAQSRLNVTRKNGVYHVATDSTQVQNLTLTSPEKETFRQQQVTAQFNVYIDPNARTINIAQLQVDSPQIHIRKGTLRQTTQGNTASLRGQFDVQFDWAAVSQAASAFVPGTVDIAGQRELALNFASTYPADAPNGLLANLNSQTSLGFDSAEYMGLNFGPTEVNVQVEQGQMHILPFSTTVNNGKLNFAAEADLSQTPILLRTTAPLQVAQGVQITDEMVGNFLQYVNPIFADAIGVSGVVNFDTQSLAIPLTAGHAGAAQLAGTIGLQKLRLQASLLNKILGVIKESIRDQVLTIRPTQIALQNGVLRYDNMQIDAGNNPINFGGAIGLNGILDMTVTLPYTYEGRTVRVGEEGQAGRRISVPLTGTLKAPQIDLQKLLQSQIQEQILGGLEELLKKSRK
jgi:hypothetical protein